ncbi:MAG: ATP-binding protein [Gemmatimonadaceae bacterium]|jgi:hypothetical protein|nr:ATP-binding protein [Gemmatimonadaceae bacterium]
MTISEYVLRAKLAESLAAPRRALTRRDLRLPLLPGKALAVIGVRRGGKTSVLAYERNRRIDAGQPAPSQLLLSFEDDRLLGVSASDVSWLLDEHARQFPDLRAREPLTLYLDEIQIVANWESLARRLIDSGTVELFLSGSSAKLLSREIATSLRGRALDVTLYPFSFREALRHAGHEPDTPYAQLPPAKRAHLDAALRSYLVEGGFPEAQGIDARDRTYLLRSYIDVMVLRDVIERHAISNVTALRWLERHLLANPGGAFSVSKAWNTAKSQGLAIGKDAMYDFLAYLEDAFLVRTVAMQSTSERQRMVNPRKAYPIDPALIPLFERSGRTQHGRTLETVVALELFRRGCDITYVRSADDTEVDFLAERVGEPPMLVQVALEISEPDTRARELRGLESARTRFPDATCWLITRDGTPPSTALPEWIQWAPAAQWLLDAW